MGLDTDLSLFSGWSERVAYNEGFNAQLLANAKQAGRDAVDQGLDRVQGRQLYAADKAQLAMEAQDFLAAPVVEMQSLTDVVDSVDDLGEVTHGEETLGMESCVALETEDLTMEQEWALDDCYNCGMISHSEYVSALGLDH